MKTFKTISKLLLLSITIFWQVAANSEVKITYYIPDASGSLVAATDEQGKVIWRKHYGPHGEELEQDAASKDNHIGYTGHVHDRDTGLTYMGARYYDPVVGRFMGMDSAGVNPNDPRTFNRFAYGNNSPYVYIDPDGRTSRKSAGGIPNGYGLPARLQALYGVNGSGRRMGSAPNKSLAESKGVGSAVKSQVAKLPAVKKAVNSNFPHARDQSVVREVFPNAKAATSGLKALTKNINKNGFPKGSILDSARADRVLVPVGNNGLAVFQVGKNGTAKLKTVLIAK